MSHLPAADDDGIFPVAEGLLLDRRVQLVAPAQPARLARPPRDVARDVGPVARPALPLFKIWRPQVKRPRLYGAS